MNIENLKSRLARCEPLAAWPLDDLGTVLSKHFGATTVTKVSEAPSGWAKRVAMAHFVATTADGRRIGVKKPSFEKVTGLRDERLAHELALMLSAPNACRFGVASLGPQYPDAMHGDVFLVEHMTGDVRHLRPLKAATISGEVLADVQAHIERFLEHQGEWMTFTQVFNIHDRHGENLLWDLHDHRLLHIDFELAFRAVYANDVTTRNTTWLEAVGFDYAAWESSDPDARRVALERGIESMHTRIHDRWPDIEQKLKAEGIPNGEIGASRMWAKYPLEKKLQRWKDALSP